MQIMLLKRQNLKKKNLKVQNLEWKKVNKGVVKMERRGRRKLRGPNHWKSSGKKKCA